VSTETLPTSYSGDTHTDTQTDRGMLEVLRTDGIRFRDIDIKFQKDGCEIQTFVGLGAQTNKLIEGKSIS
jgi:hypothetical protein